MPTAPRSSRFDDQERAAWAGFLSTHHQITRRLDMLISEQEGLTLTEFEVLLKLSLAGGHLRMSDLADAAWLSRSGLTRIVDELEHQGLVKRITHTDDARVTQATLTATGRKRFARAHRRHVANVRTLFLDPLSPDQRRTLATAWPTIQAALPDEPGRTPRSRRRSPRPTTARRPTN